MRKKSAKELRKISKEQRKILNVEKKIEREERQLLLKDRRMEKEMSGLKLIAAKGAVHSIHKVHSLFARRVAKHSYIFATIITVGGVLIWRGLWDLSEKVIESSALALLVGFILLWSVKKYTDTH